MTVVRYTALAATHADDVARWWHDNRGANSKFLDELARTEALLASAPGVGVQFKRGHYRRIRRILLRECEQHGYFLHDDRNDIVWIVAIWGARRGKGPKLVLPP